MRGHRAIAGVAAVLFTLAACGAPARDALAGNYDVKGGGAPLKVFQALADEFGRRHPSVTFHFEDVGSVPGMTLVANGEADLATSSTEPPANLKDKIELVSVGLSGTGVVVAAGNPITNLTREQVRKIFAGEITDWSAVGGPAGRIFVAVRPKGSAIRRSFDGYVFAGVTNPMYARDAFEVNDTDQTIAALSGRRDVIAYITVDERTLSDKSLRLVALDGVSPTKETLTSGVYPMRRPLYLAYAKTGVKPAIQAFVDFVRSDDGKRIIAAAGRGG